MDNKNRGEMAKALFEQFKSYWTFATISVGIVIAVFSRVESTVDASFAITSARLDRFKLYVDAGDMRLRDDQIRNHDEEVARSTRIESKVDQILFRLPKPYAGAR